MKNIFGKPVWNPYLAGALAGVLAVLSAVVSTSVLGKPKYLGASTTFVRVAGMVERQAAPGHVARNEYFTGTKVQIDWQMLFVCGIFLGALASSLLGRTFKAEKVPPMWDARFGRSIGLRAMAAVAGGALAMVGARLAGGCPSGHGLSGMMQLAVSGLIAMIFFMAGGFAAARFFYKK